jgi:hypothetical protein
MRFAVLAAAAVMIAAPANAQDKLFDASKPPEVANALRAAGYKAELKTNKQNEPYISSSANGSSFTIEFYGCKVLTDCGSMQFYGWYKKEPFQTLAMVNEWNSNKRFLKLSIDKDGDLALWMDVAGVGKMTQAAFADWVDWYSVMDSELDKFLTEKRKAAGGEPANPKTQTGK